jgi:hypothetical protein
MSHQPQADQKDVDLQTRIRVALSAEQRDGYQGIRIRVEERVATLWGDVPSHFVRQLAIQSVRRLPGIRGIIDQMTVAGKTNDAPASFGRSIKTAVVLFVLAAAALTGCHSNAAALNPVEGQIIVNGRPLPNAQVVLRSDNPDVPVAQGQTDAEGKFSLTTFNKHDGAPEGDFRVTVAYYRHVQVNGDLLPGPNVLPTKYSDPARTELRVSVRKGDNHLPPITLQL